MFHKYLKHLGLDSFEYKFYLFYLLEVNNLPISHGTSKKTNSMAHDILSTGAYKKLY